MIFIRELGHDATGYAAIEFIDASQYDIDDAKWLLKRTLRGYGRVIGVVEKENFWAGEHVPLHEANGLFSILYHEFQSDGTFSNPEYEETFKLIKPNTMATLIENLIESAARAFRYSLAVRKVMPKPSVVEAIKTEYNDNICRLNEALTNWLKRKKAQK
jgi:hypothetical protein